MNNLNNDGIISSLAVAIYGVLMVGAFLSAIFNIRGNALVLASICSFFIILFYFLYLNSREDKDE
jgi:hypothetical protein